MKTIVCAALAAFSASLALAAPRAGLRHVRHERRGDSPHWIKRASVAPTFSIPMRIGLSQGNLDRGYDLLMEVSDPSSPKYGQHYSVEAVHDLFAPSSESVDAVFAWLHEAGIDLERVSQSMNKQWLQLDLHTSEAEDLLKTKFHIYEHTLTGKSHIGCDEYHVKEGIQHHIDYITPGVKTIEVRSRSEGKLSRRSSPPPTHGPFKTALPPGNHLFSSSSTKYCDTYITPACIMAMYNMTKGKTHVAGNELGIFEETPQWLDQSDLDLYFARLANQIPNGTFPTVNEIDGADNKNDPNDAGVEALLDFQVSYPLIWPQNSVLFSTDADDPANLNKGGLFNTFLDAIDGSYCTYSAFGETGDSPIDPTYPVPQYNQSLQCGVFQPTNVISFSYDLAEFTEHQTPAYQMRQCNEYMKLGLQGVSLVFSSGDYGVASAFGCAAENNHAVFNPTFPANCPYVTSVGSTTLVGKAGKDAEIATTQFPSGGGFSNYFARPSYQDSAVKGYFKSSAAPNFPHYTGETIGKGLYNRSGRGIPDVAAVGQAILNFGDGEAYVVGGTSASAPIFASMLTRINEERLSAKMSTIGFVNPVLYQNPHAFHDITVGSNPEPKFCNKKGFSAGEGWDPVTGLGTPNYPALLEAFMKTA